MKHSIAFIIVLLLHTVAHTQNTITEDSVQYFYFKGDYTAAKNIAQQNVLKIQATNDTTTKQYATALNTLGYVNYSLAYFKQAIEIYNRALNIQRHINEASSIDSATTLINLGEVYYALEKEKEANFYATQVAQLFTPTYFNNKEYIRSQILIGNVHNMHTDFHIAEIYLKRAVEKSRELNGEKSFAYSQTLYQLAYLYYRMSYLSLAEKNIQQAITIQKNTIGEMHPEYAKSLHHLGRIQIRMDMYDFFEPILRKVIAIQTATLPPNHLENQIAKHNLGYLYTHQQKKLQEADSLITSTTFAFKDIYGVKGARYINGIINKAELYELQKKYKAVDSLYTLYLSIISKDSLQHSNHTNFVEVLNGLGNMNYLMGNYKKADSCYRLSYSIIRDFSGQVNRTFLIACNGLARTTFCSKQYHSCQDFAIRSLKSENIMLWDKLDFLSQVELMNYVFEREQILTFPFSLLKKHPSPFLIQQVYNNRLLFSGVTLQNEALLTKQICTSTDTTIVSLFKAYQNTRIQIFKVMGSANPEKNPLLDSLSQAAVLLEKQLLRQSANYRNIKEKINITWKDIQANLQSHEVAIEFVKYNTFNKSFTDTACYAAMIITPYDTAPIFVYLAKERDIVKHLKTYAYKGNSRGNNQNTAVPQTALYNTILKPLEKYFNHTQTIYFAPDGLLHQVSFAAIPYKKDSLLCDKYKLIQLTSTRQIVLNNQQQENINSITLFGGINYNKQLFDTSTTTTNSFYLFAKKRGSTTLSNFNYLPHTLTEVKGIEKTMTHLHKNVVVSTKEKATEAMFKSLGGSQSPQVIHFATHGFTLPKLTHTSKDIPTNSFIASNNPLLRCGLVMAGGNIGWKGKNHTNEDDGILTGEEISNVPLPNTQLVVLSACETGLGKLQGSEGVFGLQRAFKIAGANYVMASLWQIPDKETAEFMQIFYAIWLNGKSIGIDEAFIKTQRKMRLKYPPYYWAGFTLVH